MLGGMRSVFPHVPMFLVCLWDLASVETQVAAARGALAGERPSCLQQRTGAPAVLIPPSFASSCFRGTPQPKQWFGGACVAPCTPGFYAALIVGHSMGAAMVMRRPVHIRMVFVASFGGPRAELSA
jgi:hypothetical protein